MTGKIFVLQAGNELTELIPSQYSNEDFFQGIIEKYPEILAGDQINPDNPRRWLLISREMGIPAEQDGGSQWYLDHLFIDQDAIPTFVEVKRSTDTRLRREVVAQMLDYAANAVQYWPITLLRETYAKNVSDANSLASIGIESEKEEAFWQSVSTNLRAGRIRLIFAADVIPASLQTIIEFLNRQMVDTEVFGLEIKQYQSANGLSTLVPSLINRIANTLSPNPSQLNEQSFLAQVAKISGPDVAVLCERVIRSYESLGGVATWGKGEMGGYIPVFGKKRHVLFALYSTTKQTLVEIQFQYLNRHLMSWSTGID